MYSSLPIATQLAVSATMRESRSALPDAPVVPETPRREPRAKRTRTSVAVLLHRAARAVEPSPAH